jgi:hypothetical protein
VNSGHDTALDSSIIVKSLSHGSEAVGGAGSSGDDLVISGEGFIVYIVNDGGKIVACGSRDNNFLSACFDVSHRLVLRGVETGAFENNVYVESAPGAILCVLASVDLDFLTVNDDGIFGSFNSVSFVTEFAKERTLSSIVFEKVSEHLGAGEVVDSNNFVAFSNEHLTECETADTTETINSNFNHGNNPPYVNKFDLEHPNYDVPYLSIF